MKVPATIGKCVDELYRLRAERLELKRRVDAIGAVESELREHVIKTYGKLGLDGAKGKIASCSISKHTIATVVDWEKALEWIRKNRAWDMLVKKISDRAFNERLDAHVIVPDDAIAPFVVTSLSLNKISGKSRKSAA